MSGASARRLVAFRAHDDPSEASRIGKFERAIFVARYGDDPRELARMHDRYADQTVLLACYIGREIEGASRIVLPGALQLQTVTASSEAPFNVNWRLIENRGIAGSRILDIMTVAVRARGPLSPAFRLLLCGVVGVGCFTQCSHALGMVDEKVYRYLGRRALVVERLCSGSGRYFGSTATVPIMADLAVLAASLGGAQTWAGAAGDFPPGPDM